jgi:uncharacterized repeat protein (TIGR03987 family)
MPGVLWAVVFINAALVLYTIAVWAERLAGRLKVWHLVFFWAGLTTDCLGTAFMFRIADGLVLDLHGLSGAVALTLMLVHTAWASVVLARRDERAIVNFHRFSLSVWLAWLVPFITGAIMGMGM